MRSRMSPLGLWAVALASVSLMGLNGYLLLRPSAPSAPEMARGGKEVSSPPASLPSPTHAFPPTASPAPATATATAAVLARPGLPLAPPTLPPTPTPQNLPPSAQVEGLPRKGQVYPLSCEAHIAVVLAAWAGMPLDEKAFQAALPLSDNPEKGFVGDVQGQWGQTPPADYGIHAPPVAALLRDYGLPAQARRGMTWRELRAEIAAGRPVGVWVVGHVGSGAPVFYTAADGTLVSAARFEHTVIVTGYTPREVTILDGPRLYTRRLGDFLRSWSVLGNMALTLTSEHEGRE